MSDILKLFLTASVMASIMICIVLVIRRAFSRRMGPAVMLLLWGMVLLRLLLPFTIPSPMQLSGLFPQQTYSTDANSGPIAAEDQTPGADPAVNSGSGLTAANAQPLNGPEMYTPTEAAPSGPAGVIPGELMKNIRWWNMLAAVWTAGIAAVLLLSIRKAVRFRRKLKFCNPVADKKILDFIRVHKEVTGVKKAVAALECDFVHAPAVFGYFKPCILIPSRFLEEMDEGSLNAILLHEIYHIRCHDILTGYIWLAAKALHWFNPLVWLAYKWFEDDVELCRDQKAAHKLNMDDAFVYSRSLLEAARFSRRTARMPSSAAALFEDRCKLRQRIYRLVKPQRKTRSAAVMSALLAMIMIFACFTTACQPTPERPVVIGKDSGASLNSVQYKKTDFPTIYQDSYSKNGANIVFDASVELPDSDKIPTYKISQTTFAQDQVDSIIKALFGDTQMYAPAEVTKSELEPAYVKALSDLKSKQDNPDQYENSEEYYQEQADELKEQIENAPDSDTLDPIDTKLKKSEQGTEHWSGRGDLGKDQMASLLILNNTDSSALGNDSFLKFRNGSAYMDMSTLIPVMQDNGPAKLKITKEEAIQKADDAVRRLGADNMGYAACATGVMENTDGHYTSDYDPQRPQAYLVYYTRNLSGVPVTYDLRSSSNDFAEDSYTVSTMYERITVAVDDTGVTYIRWQGPINIDGISVENNKIVPFEDVITLAKNQLGYSYAAYDENRPQPSGPSQAQASSPIDNGRIVGNDVHIQRITLGFMQLPIKDENRGELVPVWDFFGYSETVYENGTRAAHYQNDKSILTINAINASVIDRERGC